MAKSCKVGLSSNLLPLTVFGFSHEEYPCIQGIPMYTRNTHVYPVKGEDNVVHYTNLPIAIIASTKPISSADILTSGYRPDPHQGGRP